MIPSRLCNQVGKSQAMLHRMTFDSVHLTNMSYENGRQTKTSCLWCGWLVVFYLWGFLRSSKWPFTFTICSNERPNHWEFSKHFSRFRCYKTGPEPIVSIGTFGPQSPWKMKVLMGETTPNSEGTVGSHVFWGPSCTESKDDWTDSPGQTQELKKSRKCHVELNKIRR